MMFEAETLTKFKLDELQIFWPDAISALLKQRDVFVSIKTGGRKSLCFQGCTYHGIRLYVH